MMEVFTARARAIGKRRVARGRSPLNGVGAAAVGVAMLVFAAAAIAAGGWSSPQRLSGAHENAVGSVVGANARGVAVAAWYRENKSGTADTLRAAVRQGASRFSAPVTLGPAVLTIGPNPPSYPSVAVDGRGDAAVAWLKKDPAGKLRVFVSYRPSRGRFGAARPVSASGSDSFQPQIAVNGRGDFTVVWQRFDNGHFVVEAATRGYRQARFGAARMLSSPRLDAQFPHLGVAANDRIAVAWRARNLKQNSSFIQGVTRTAAGKLGPRQALSKRTLDADNPSVAMAPGGQAMVVWEETNGTTRGQIGAAFSTARTFGREQVLAPLANHEAINPSVAIDARGRAVVLWLEGPSPGKTGADFIRWAQAGAKGRFGAPRTLYQAASLLSPKISVSPRGAAVAVWIRVSASSSSSTALLSAMRPSRAKTLRLTGRVTPAAASPEGPDLAASSKSATTVWVWHKPGNRFAVYANQRRLR
jgi:hypothetical protein